jgi:NhaA family Na+:H+ antiporter
MKLTKLFVEFFNSERAGGLVLIMCTLISLVFVNSSFQNDYLSFWQMHVAGHSLIHWINDGLMAIFFLLIGLELEREIYEGELSDIKNALLPVAAAIGGMVAPAGFFLLFNYGSETQSGAGIPTATDIAFALGILSLLGKRVPGSLKVFLTALAVIDDLGAIIVIAIFYTSTLAWINLIIALAFFGLLLVLNKWKVYNLVPYIIGGIFMWYFMSISGVHATITGVLLAFAIPFRRKDAISPSDKLLHLLHKPVAFVILPLFALANTAIIINGNWLEIFSQPVSLGILSGLVIGKPLGITLFSYLAVVTGICALPQELKWRHIAGVGLIAGIGFTMSIFITLLAFNQEVLINNSKLMVLVGSLIAGTMGFVLLKLTLKSQVLE